MPVDGSFLRTSINPDLMMYMETPCAPSRTMTSDAANSAVFKQEPSLARLSGPSSAKSLMFFRNWITSPVSFVTVAICLYVSFAQGDEKRVVSHPDLGKSKTEILCGRLA